MAIEITLPTFHAGQIKIYQNRTKRNSVRCGRRFGKTKMMVTLGGDASIKGRKVGIFTPEHKQLFEPYYELLSILQPIKTQASKNDGIIRVSTGGLIDFWHLNDNELAGRGREYDLVLLDEAAFTKNAQMMRTWETAIMPTMATRPNAEVWLFSTPNGNDPENFFYKACREPDLGFKEFWAPSSENPAVSEQFLAEERIKKSPLAFSQEYDAEFVDWSGVAFFAEDKMLLDGRPLDMPDRVDYVFAVIDTALKDGKQHDGTAVTIWAYSKFRPAYPLLLLDWDCVQIEGAILEHWLPTIFQRLEELAKQCGARYGSAGAYIEDKASGIVLLQQAANRGWPAQPLPGALTALGKDERALSVSGYAYQGLMKITRPAFEKTTDYKGVHRNHFLAQVCGFRLGSKRDAQDDLLDCATYSMAIALGNSDGF
jgi:hypothetical protein